MSVTVRIFVNNEPFFEREFPINDGDTLNLDADHALGDLKRQRDELLAALNDLAAWPDGNIGSHMDEPHAASVARRLLAKYNKPKHLPADDTEGGLHD
jgi:hypothetical protein